MLNNTKNLELPYGVVLPEVNGLMLDYNGHMSSYMSIEEYYENSLDCSDEWVSEEERKLAIDNNSVWHIHWYPITPISSYKILCYSLEKGLDYLVKLDRKETNMLDQYVIDCVKKLREDLRQAEGFALLYENEEGKTRLQSFDKRILLEFLDNMEN